jgi:hypothetical protein
LTDNPRSTCGILFLLKLAQGSCDMADSPCRGRLPMYGDSPHVRGFTTCATKVESHTLLAAACGSARGPERTQTQRQASKRPPPSSSARIHKGSYPGPIAAPNCRTPDRCAPETDRKAAQDPHERLRRSPSRGGGISSPGTIATYAGTALWSQSGNTV